MYQGVEITPLSKLPTIALSEINSGERLWKGTELGTIHIAAFCTHPFPYRIRHIMELFCIGGGNAGEQQEVTKVNIWNTQLISGREISTI